MSNILVVESKNDKFFIDNETLTKKDFDKFWISNYLRFDTCSKEEKKQAGKYCSMAAFDYVMANKKEIGNFDAPILDELKDFLRLFCSDNLANHS